MVLHPRNGDSPSEARTFPLLRRDTRRHRAQDFHRWSLYPGTSEQLRARTRAPTTRAASDHCPTLATVSRGCPQRPSERYGGLPSPERGTPPRSGPLGTREEAAPGAAPKRHGTTDRRQRPGYARLGHVIADQRPPGHAQFRLSDTRLGTEQPPCYRPGVPRNWGISQEHAYGPSADRWMRSRTASRAVAGAPVRGASREHSRGQSPCRSTRPGQWPQLKESSSRSDAGRVRTPVMQPHNHVAPARGGLPDAHSEVVQRPALDYRRSSRCR